MSDPTVERSQELGSSPTPQQSFSASLRALADWYDQHPSVPLPYSKVDFRVSNFTASPEELRAIGPGRKEYTDDWFYYVVGGDAFTLKFCEYRERVCTRRVVGKKLVPEVITPAHEEDIVEWDCGGSLLSEQAEVAA